MTHRPGQPSTLPWLTTAAPAAHAHLPAMEPLLPKMEPLQPKITPPATQRSTRKRQARPGPQARRAAKRETHTKLVLATQEQPRDSIGRFAEKKGSFLTRFFDPTPHAPTHLKQLPPRQAGQQRHPITAPPRARASQKRRKKPVPERGVMGRILALFNGDYARWRRNDLRQRARWRMQAEGHYVPPRKRTRRRRKAQTTPALPPRKRGIVRRLLGL
jgi:hypothetical protein